MALGGHKTASVYRRYRIVDEEDIRQALAWTFTATAPRPLATIVPPRREG